jgi:rod shape-determining protein MreD
MRPAPHFTFWISVLLAMILQLWALPESLAAARPLWLPLVLGFWALMEPRVPALTAAFVVGLMLDVLFSTLLGQNALCMIFVVFLIARMRSLFGLFPLWQAMIGLIPVWAIYTLLQFWVDGMAHQSADGWLRWLPVATTTLFWPPVYLLLDGLRSRRRNDD